MDWWRDQIRRGMNPRAYALVGLLVLMLLWIQSLDGRAKALRAQGRAPASERAVPALAPAERRALLAGLASGWGSDPFSRRFPATGDEGPARAPLRAAGTPAPRSTGLYLQGVTSGPLGRTALINGNAYREGEKIGGLEVLQIGRRSVMLLDHGTVTTLHLKGDGS